MAPDSGESRRGNPFPVIPVVRLGPSADLGDVPVEASDSGSATVRTPTIDELTQLVEDYLTERPPGGRRGRAIALVGHFGLGKSHALREVYALLGARPERPATWIVDEPMQDMGRMYRDRLRGPGDTDAGRRAFEDLVRDYYAYVTARRVGEQGPDPRLGDLDDIAAGLRDHTLDPAKVVSALRYDPEVIHADLRGTLGEVTEHRRFATALALLLDPRHTRMVWKWLNGMEPAEPLRERGITESIGPQPGAVGPAGAAAGIDLVFDALAVQGFLHGRVGKPYVLLLDSLEKVLDWPADTGRVFVDAFERLVNIFASRGGLLVFCVSPRGLQALRPSVHERLVQLWPAGLSEELTVRLVDTYVGTAESAEPPLRGLRASGPFGPDALRLLHELTDGVPREVLKTCRQAWQISEDEDGAVREVPAQNALRAVRELHEKVSRRQVEAEVHEALGLGQWRIASRDPVASRLSSPAGVPEEVLHWIAPATNAHLAVILTRSVLVADDVERVAAHVQGLRGAVSPARFEPLVVVNGRAANAMQDRLARVIGSRPLVYRQGDFPRRVHEALRQLERRIVDGRREEDLDRLGERMRRDLAQQSDRLDGLSRAMAELATEARTGATAQRSAPGTSADFPGPGGPAEDEAGTQALPGAVRSSFLDVLAVLDAAGRRMAGRAVGRRGATTPAELGLLGCVTLVRSLTVDFRRAVADWYHARSPAAPTEAQLGELRRICREYAYAVEVLPVHRLDNAGPPHPLTAARTVELLAEEVWGALSVPAAP
ncbi:hypothetical protein [Streptomyces sp. AM 2-1-1]|uniref:hypothetical protein n=1 Tax=Streptomyces sp. AM 2-1-1 TaxID=3028709 RepID=UPI0023B9CC17|nr:hypothetical protein [Streptomyces sp. AM 2-1-1]WEH39883.1 hypothetical protein PZB77_10330 [Streptomyces sp. AM 2-1-1]